MLMPRVSQAIEAFRLRLTSFVFFFVSHLLRRWAQSRCQVTNFAFYMCEYSVAILPMVT